MMLDRLYRRVQLAVGIGRTTAAPADSGAVQTVQVRLQPDNAVRDASKVVQLYGFSSSMPVGSDVIMLFLGGDRSSGVVIGTANQTARKRNQKPGEVSVHGLGIEINLTSAGLVINAGGKPVTITNGTKARFEMPVESTGEITAKVDGAAVHLSTHTHADPQGSNVGTPTG